MATIDLGKIKLVWRGTYAGGTDYTVDDVVQHTDGGITSSFICTTNSTGNAPSTGGSVHGSWAYLAKGGAAGTDVGTTLTTQGDVLYRDGSGLQRLAKGTAAQVLKMNTAANAPEWGNLSSDFVKLYEADDVSGASEINFNGYFNDNYKVYKIFGCHTGTSGGNSFNFRVRSGTNGATEDSNSNYWYAYGYNSRNSGGSSQNGFTGSQNASEWRFGWCGDGGTDNHNTFDLTFYEPTGTNQRMVWTGIAAMWDNGYAGMVVGGGHKTTDTQMTGIKFYHGSGNIAFKWVKIYGMK